MGYSPAPANIVCDIFISPRRAFRVVFRRAEFDTIMRTLRGRPVRVIKLMPSATKYSGRYSWMIADPDWDEIKIGLANHLPFFLDRARPERLQRAIILALAHEAAHACQPKNIHRPLEFFFPWMPTLFGSGWILLSLGRRTWSLLITAHGITSIVSHVCQVVLLGFLSVIGLVAAIVIGFALSYYLSRSELQANWFAFRNSHKPEWRSLVTVTALSPEEINAILDTPRIVSSQAQSS